MGKCNKEETECDLATVKGTLGVRLGDGPLRETVSGRNIDLTISLPSAYMWEPHFPVLPVGYALLTKVSVTFRGEQGDLARPASHRNFVSLNRCRN